MSWWTRKARPSRPLTFRWNYGPKLEEKRVWPRDTITYYGDYGPLLRVEYDKDTLTITPLCLFTLFDLDEARKYVAHREAVS